MKNRVIVTAWIVVLFYPLLFLWQGLDFTDTGFFLYSYQQFFNYPDTPMMASWLTGVLGYLTDNFMGVEGVLGFRLAFVPLIWLAIWIVYKIIINIFPKADRLIILISIFIAYNLNGWNTGILTYSSLTGLLLLFSFALLYFGLLRSLNYLLLLSGVIVGINIFIRIPNILCILLFTVIFVYSKANNMGWLEIIKKTGVFFLGISIGFSLIIFIIYKCGHLNFYLEKVMLLFKDSNESGSTHSMYYLLLKYIRDYSISLILAIIIIFVSFLSLNKLHKFNKLVIYILYFSVAIASLFLFWKYIISGLLLIILFLLFLKNYKQNNEIMIISYI